MGEYVDLAELRRVLVTGGARQHLPTHGGGVAYRPPSRGLGTTASWVAPLAVQDGTHIRLVADGSEVIPRGVANADEGTFGDILEGLRNVNHFSMLLSTPVITGTPVPGAGLGGNTFGPHLYWSDIEPYRPLGGDPVAGTFSTRDYRGIGGLALLDSTFLPWCETNNIYTIFHVSGTANGTGPYFGATRGTPSWMYDDSLWAAASTATVTGTQTPSVGTPTLTTSSVTPLAAGVQGPGYPANGWAVVSGHTVAYSAWSGTTMTLDPYLYTTPLTFTAGNSIVVGGDVSNHVAPMPAFRNEYNGGGGSTGAGYATTDKPNAITANSARGVTAITSTGGGQNWHGDGTKRLLYFDGLISQYASLGGKYPHCLGYMFYNEPNVGDLGNTLGAQPGPINEMLRVQAAAYDYYRTLDPQRFICYMGVSSHAQHASMDASILWTVAGAGGGGACPDSYAYMEKIDWYTSGAIAYTLPLDQPGADQQSNAADPTKYLPTRDVFGAPTNEVVAVDAWNSYAAARGVPLIFGEYAIGSTVTNAAAFVADMDTVFRRHSTPSLYFQFSKSTGFGLLTKTGTDGAGNDTYSLNATTGVALQAAMATPYPTTPFTTGAYIDLGELRLALVHHTAGNQHLPVHSL